MSDRTGTASSLHADAPQQHHLSRDSGAYAISFLDKSGSSESEDDFHWILVSIVAVGRTSRNYPQVPVGTFRVSSLKAFLASVSFCGHTGCVRNALFFTCRASTLRTIGFMLSAGKRVEFSLKKRPGPDLGIRLRSSMERVGWGFKEWYGRHKGCRTRGFAWKLFKFAGLVSRRVSYKIYVLIFFTPNTLQGTSN